MDSHTLEILTVRIEAAERALRSARRAMWLGSIVVLLVSAGAVLWALDPTLGRGPGKESGTVEAQRFVVRDAQGSARAVLEALPSGGTQLVFFREPLAGDTWREHTGTGPFSFGVRSVRDLSQLVLSNSSGEDLQFTPANLSMGKHQTPGFVVSAGPTPGIWLADSTGRMQMLNANVIADVLAKHPEPARPPQKHRRKR
jgi:hypothetical protein